MKIFSFEIESDLYFGRYTLTVIPKNSLKTVDIRNNDII